MASEQIPREVAERWLNEEYRGDVADIFLLARALIAAELSRDELRAALEMSRASCQAGWERAKAAEDTLALTEMQRDAYRKIAIDWETGVPASEIESGSAPRKGHRVTTQLEPT